MWFLWHDEPLICTAEDLVQNHGVCRYPNGNNVLQFYSVKDRVNDYVGALIGILVAWRVLAYFVLVSKSKRAVGRKIAQQ